MKTFNKQYNGIADLEEFIIENKIVKCDNILLQIFTGVCDVEFIENLTAKIRAFTNKPIHTKQKFLKRDKRNQRRG